MIWVYSSRSLQDNTSEEQVARIFERLKDSPILQRVEIAFVPGDPTVLDISATCDCKPNDEFATRCMFETANDEWRRALGHADLEPQYLRSEIKAYHYTGG